MELGKIERWFWIAYVIIVFGLVPLVLATNRFFLEITDEFLRCKTFKEWKIEFKKIKRWACYYTMEGGDGSGSPLNNIVLEDDENKHYVIDYSLLYKNQLKIIYRELETKFGHPVKNEMIFGSSLGKDIDIGKI